MGLTMMIAVRDPKMNSSTDLTVIKAACIGMLIGIEVLATAVTIWHTAANVFWVQGVFQLGIVVFTTVSAIIVWVGTMKVKHQMELLSASLSKNRKQKKGAGGHHIAKLKQLTAIVLVLLVGVAFIGVLSLNTPGVPFFQPCNCRKWESVKILNIFHLVVFAALTLYAYQLPKKAKKTVGTMQGSKARPSTSSRVSSKVKVVPFPAS